MDLLKDVKCRIEYYKVVCGKQAVDTCIIAYLGYLVGSEKQFEFTIVSNDNGYHYALEFLKQVNDKTKTTSSSAIAVQKNRSDKNQNGSNVPQQTEKLHRILTSFGLRQNDVYTVEKILGIKEQEKGEHKSRTYDLLTDKLGQKKGLRAYNAVKKYLV